MEGGRALSPPPIRKLVKESVGTIDLVRLIPFFPKSESGCSCTCGLRYIDAQEPDYGAHHVHTVHNKQKKERTKQEGCVCRKENGFLMFSGGKIKQITKALH